MLMYGTDGTGNGQSGSLRGRRTAWTSRGTPKYHLELGARSQWTSGNFVLIHYIEFISHRSAQNNLKVAEVEASDAEARRGQIEELLSEIAKLEDENKRVMVRPISLLGHLLIFMIRPMLRMLTSTHLSWPHSGNKSRDSVNLYHDWHQRLFTVQRDAQTRAPLRTSAPPAAAETVRRCRRPLS